MRGVVRTLSCIVFVLALLGVFFAFVELYIGISAAGHYGYRGATEDAHQALW